MRVERDLAQAVEVSPEEELVIYRVAQEALTNVARHAEASRVRLELRAEQDSIVLAVGDDGRGIPEDARDSAQGLPRHARTRDARGCEAFDREPAGQGTVIRLAIAR